MKTLLELLLAERKEVTYSILLGAVSGVTAIALFAMSGFMISKAALAPPFYTILILTAFLKLFGAVKSTSKYFERLISHRVTFQALGRIRMHFFERLEPLVPHVFNKYRSGDLLSRFVGDVEVLQHFFLRVVYPPLVALTVFFTTIFFTVFFSGWIALVLLLGILLVAIVIPILLTKQLTHTDVISKRSILSTETAEFLSGYRELKLHHQVNSQRMVLQQAQDAYEDEQFKTTKTQLWSQTLTAGVGSLISFLVLVIGAYLVSTGELNGLYLAMLVLVALTSFESTVPLATIPSYLHDSKQAMNRLEQVTDIPEPKEQQLIPNSSYLIEVKDVSFRYADVSRDTLDSISLTLPAGSRTAIVGASGSGKSTLLQLIGGVIDPSEGTISYNQQSIRNVQPESLWEHIGFQLQSSHFFYGTIRGNLLIAKPEATDEELVSALREAQLDMGLDAAVYERGENLSGGEKQRLAFARLFLKEASVWLLDEPYTSLDALTETRLSKEVQNYTTLATVVLISHKLDGLEEMDQIVVMDRGRIVEVGSFDELMQLKGMFYEMKRIEDEVI